MPEENQTAVTAPEADGTRVRRAFMMKNFLPDPDWINKNVVAGGKGTHKKVGRIIGFAIGATKRINDIGGKPTESISLNGKFEVENYLSGEISQPSVIYTPMAFSEQVQVALLSDGVQLVQIDVDVGVEATGKTIPYEWTITSFLEAQDSQAMLQLRHRRGPRKASLTAIEGGKEAPLLEHEDVKEADRIADEKTKAHVSSVSKKSA